MSFEFNFMHYIFYGPEGSGKGTQAKLLAEKLHLPILTSGDLVRDAAVNDKGLIGDACRRALKEGRYVPDSEMFVLWKNKLRSEEAKKGFILDGFPRNLRQAKFLMRKISKYRYGIDKLIHLNLNDKDATERLLKRNRKTFEGSNESHDTIDKIGSRLASFREHEKDLIAYFGEKNLLLSVDASGSVSEIHGRILKDLSIPS